MGSSMMEPSTPSTTCPMDTKLQDQCHGCPLPRRGQSVPRQQDFLVDSSQDLTHPPLKTATPLPWSQVGILARLLLAPPIMKTTIIILSALTRGRGGVRACLRHSHFCQCHSLFFSDKWACPGIVTECNNNGYCYHDRCACYPGSTANICTGLCDAASKYLDTNKNNSMLFQDSLRLFLF